MASQRKTPFRKPPAKGVSATSACRHTRLLGWSTGHSIFELEGVILAQIHLYDSHCLVFHDSLNQDYPRLFESLFLFEHTVFKSGTLQGIKPPETIWNNEDFGNGIPHCSSVGLPWKPAGQPVIYWHNGNRLQIPCRYIGYIKHNFVTYIYSYHLFIPISYH